MPRVVAGTVIACAAAAGGFTIASNGSGHLAAATPSRTLSAGPQSSKSSVTTTTTMPRAPWSKPSVGGLGPGFAGGFNMGGPPGMIGVATGGTVTKVGSSTITVRSQLGEVITVTTNSKTTYSRNGVTISRSAVVPGVQVEFRFVRYRAPSGSSAQELVMSVEIVTPRISGDVVSMSGSQLVVEQSDGLYVTVNTFPSTTYEQSGQTATSAAVEDGSFVVVTGTATSDHTEFDATTIEVVLPSVTGRVTAVSGTTITISTFAAVSETVTTTAATTFRNRSGKTTIASVTKGDLLEATGTPGTGNTFAATTVVIGPAVTAPGGFMGPGGSFGFGGFGWKGGPSGPPGPFQGA